MHALPRRPELVNIRARPGIGPCGSVRVAGTSEHAFEVAKLSVIWLVVLGNTVAIVWLWLAGGGVSGVHGVADLLTSTGRITGLLGAYFLLLQVLLLARLSWIEQRAGFDRLTIWHRRNGKLSLGVIVAHTVLITLGYAMTDKLSIPREASQLLTSYPGMVTATVGTGLLVVVVLTSLVIVRRRLRYEAWYLVHFMAYVGIILAWSHQIPTGNEFSASPAAAAYWTALYLATLALLVLFRLAQPIVGACRFRLRVADVKVESGSVVSLSITGDRLDRLNARSGQFFLWRFLTSSRWWESHPFSLSAAPRDDVLRITVKNVGDFTSHIGDIAPGTRVVAEGPFGVFTGSLRTRPGVALIAGGIGITPIRALVEDMSGDLILVYRVLRDEDLVFRHELEHLARDRSVSLCYVVGDHAAPGGERLLSPEHLRQLIPDIADREVYVCGPPVMARAIETAVRRAHVPSKYIHVERFAL